MAATHLTIRNFAQIDELSLEFGDLTVLVGAQGTGKSLALSWLKAALDGKQVVSALEDAGQKVDSLAVVDLIFGVGMGGAWSRRTSVHLDGREVKRESIRKRGNGSESVFFIPAHRATLISDGWAAPFQRLSADTPVVARLFSQNLFDLFSGKDPAPLFPRKRQLKGELRQLIDDAVFHSGRVGLEEDAQHARRLRLTHGKAQLPFMTWTAGQREFTPLLLGLYHLLPSRKQTKQPGINWVVIEEPEMGLHPQAVCVFMLLVLELLWRGYRVVLSTHSPVILSAMWMLQVLRDKQARWQLVRQGFGTSGQWIKPLAEGVLDHQANLKTYLLEFVGNRVRSKDISTLDAGSDDPAISGWGGLTSYTSQMTDAVRQAVADEEAKQ